MIQRNISQIWCGPSPIPERERVWCAQMAKMNSTWKHTLHGNELFDRFGNDPYIKAMLGKGEKWAFVIDRLRILLLRDEGGVYVDADAEPVKPLDSLPVWDMPHVDFVAGLRSPSRKDVALHRAVPIVDNTFLASAQGGRVVQHIEALWTPTAITGENHAINGHRVGIAILEHASYDTVLLNFRYIYCETKYPESIILHDSHNLGSWLSTPGVPRTCKI